MGSFVLLSFKARFVIANLRACRLKVASIAFSDSLVSGSSGLVVVSQVVPQFVPMFALAMLCPLDVW